MLKLTLILAALALSPSAFAEIYKWTDANGNVHFSDRANSNAKTVDIKPNRPLTPQKYAAKRRAKAPGKVGVTRIISQSKQD